MRRASSRALSAAIVAALLSLASGCAGQPNMASALDSLRSARRSLERASHNKGGHRVRALAFTEQAISEVEMGIQVGNGQ